MNAPFLNGNYLETDLDGAVFIVTLPPPDEGGVTRRTLRQLSGVLRSINVDDEVRVLLLRGSPRAFCLGLNLDEFLEEDGLEELSHTLIDCFLSFNQLDVPFVASLEGPASGFGVTLLSHADMVISAPDVTLSAPFHALGVLPEAGSTLLLPRLMGYPRAFEFLCLGEPMDARQAHGCGLVSRINPCPDKEALHVARQLARLPPTLLKATRRLLRADRNGLDERITTEIQASHKRLKDPEIRKRIDRFSRLQMRNTMKRSMEEQHV